MNSLWYCLCLLGFTLEHKPVTKVMKERASLLHSPKINTSLHQKRKPQIFDIYTYYVYRKRYSPPGYYKVVTHLAGLISLITQSLYTTTFLLLVLKNNYFSEKTQTLNWNMLSYHLSHILSNKLVGFFFLLRHILIHHKDKKYIRKKVIKRCSQFRWDRTVMITKWTLILKLQSYINFKGATVWQCSKVEYKMGNCKVVPGHTQH